MSPLADPVSEFERNARALLAQSVSRVDARTRSRLNQARHGALAAAAATRQPRWWRSFTLMPAAGAAVAALLVAMVLWYREPPGEAAVMTEAQHPAMEDMDLLADSDALEMMEGWDGFYEWAADQTETNGESNS